MSKKVRRYRVKIQNEVIDELDAIYSFIFENSPSRARGFVRSLQKRILNLRDLPRRGSRVKLLEDTEIPGEIRFIEHQAYLIFYTINKNEIVVLHVAGPGQDWLRLFLK